MPPKGRGGYAGGPPAVKKISLIATDDERSETSKTMYHDYKTRVSTHPPFMSDDRRIKKFVTLFQNVTKAKSVFFIGGGMGFGLLPMLCAKYGASRVVAVDDSNVIPTCKALALDNKFPVSKLEFIQGSVRKSTTPLLNEKFDFIFCDWVSNLLTNNDASIEELLVAKEKYLAPNGEVLPSSVDLHAIGLNDYEYFQSTVEWWSNVYGFRMNTMRECVIGEPSTGSIPQPCITTTPTLVTSMDALSITKDSTSYSSKFTLKVNREATTLHYITMYPTLKYITKDGNGFSLTCSPGDNEAPIQQTSFCLPEFVPAALDDEIKVEFSVKPVPGTTPPRVTAHLKVDCDSAVCKTTYEKDYSYADYH